MFEEINWEDYDTPNVKPLRECANKNISESVDNETIVNKYNDSSLNDYYDITKTLSHNAKLNIVIGNRGGGKTYAWKKYAIEQFFKNGHEWVYCRRYNDELQTKSTFFNDIRSTTTLLDGYEVKVVGWKAMIRVGDDGDSLVNTGDFASDKEGWIPFGYFIPVADAQKYKSTSLTKVHNVCFDEFIIENMSRRYITGEVDIFAGLIDTIDRRQDRVKVFMLSNAGSMNNQYFRSYNVKPSDIMQSKKNYCKRRNNMIMIEWFNGKGRSSTGTIVDVIGSEEYKMYADENMFKDDWKHNVDKSKDDESEVIFRITDGEQTIGIKILDGGSLFITDSKISNDGRTVLINAKVKVEGLRIISPGILRQLFTMNTYYESMQAKYKYADLMQCAFLK